MIRPPQARGSVVLLFLENVVENPFSSPCGLLLGYQRHIYNPNGGGDHHVNVGYASSRDIEQRACSYQSYHGIWRAAIVCAGDWGTYRENFYY